MTIKAWSIVLTLVAGSTACGSQESKDAVKPPPPPPAATAAPPAAPAAAATDSGAKAAPPQSASADSGPADNSLVRREAYEYSASGRDPFRSLLAGGEAGPEFGDLVLVAVYEDMNDQANSLAVLRDKVSNKRYRVREGDRLGRLRVTEIRVRDVSFKLDDFGTERTETLSLRKREDETP